MSSYKLPFGLILEETAVILLLLVYRLLLLRYVLVVSHFFLVYLALTISYELRMRECDFVISSAKVQKKSELCNFFMQKNKGQPLGLTFVSILMKETNISHQYGQTHNCC